MFGISNYKTDFYLDASPFCEKFYLQLNDLIGKSIQRFWLMWDVKRNEWNRDGPVILEIGSSNFEFLAYDLNEFSLTINTIDITKKLDWYGSGDELPLIWKENSKTELLKSLHRSIEEINVVVYNFTSEINNNEVNPMHVAKLYNDGFVLHGLEFILKKKIDSDIENYFSIYNALDENGIKNKEIGGYSGLQKIKISRFNNFKK